MDEVKAREHIDDNLHWDEWHCDKGPLATFMGYYQGWLMDKRVTNHSAANISALDINSTTEWNIYVGNCKWKHGESPTFEEAKQYVIEEWGKISEKVLKDDRSGIE